MHLKRIWFCLDSAYITRGYTRGLDSEKQNYYLKIWDIWKEKAPAWDVMTNKLITINRFDTPLKNYAISSSLALSISTSPVSELTFCSSDDILLSLFLIVPFNSLISLSNCSTSGVFWNLLEWLWEKPVCDKMPDVDVDP